jgi:hypothetical protein
LKRAKNPKQEKEENVKEVSKKHTTTTKKKKKMRRAESAASLSNKAPAVGGAVNAFLHSGCEYGASVV